MAPLDALAATTGRLWCGGIVLALSAWSSFAAPITASNAVIVLHAGTGAPGQAAATELAARLSRHSGIAVRTGAAGEAADLRIHLGVAGGRPGHRAE